MSSDARPPYEGAPPAEPYSAGPEGGVSGETGTGGGPYPADPGPVGPAPAEQEGAVQAHSSHEGGAPTKLTPRRDWLALRLVIGLVGLLLVANGVWGALAGTAGLPGSAGPAASSPTLESDHSFLSAVLAGVGLAFLWVAWALARSGVFLGALCGIVFLGGIARVLAWALFGLPHWSMILLMIAELVVPPLLVLWHGWIQRTQHLKESFLADRAPQ